VLEYVKKKKEQAKRAKQTAPWMPNGGKGGGKGKATAGAEASIAVTHGVSKHVQPQLDGETHEKTFEERLKASVDAWQANKGVALTSNARNSTTAAATAAAKSMELSKKKRERSVSAERKSHAYAPSRSTSPPPLPIKAPHAPHLVPPTPSFPIVLGSSVEADEFFASKENGEEEQKEDERKVYSGPGIPLEEVETARRNEEEGQEEVKEDLGEDEDAQQDAVVVMSDDEIRTAALRQLEDKQIWWSRVLERKRSSEERGKAQKS